MAARDEEVEAYGHEFELAPASKINALRMQMAGKSDEYFDIWEAYRVTTDARKSDEEMLSTEAIAWTLERSEIGAGGRTLEQDMSMKECTPSVSKAKQRARAMAKENVTSAVRPGISLESARTRRRAKM